MSLFGGQGRGTGLSLPACEILPPGRKPVYQRGLAHMGSIMHISGGKVGSPPSLPPLLTLPGCVLPHTQPQWILSSLMPKQPVEFLPCTSHSRCAAAKMRGSAQRSKSHPEVNLQRVPTGLTFQLPMCWCSPTAYLQGDATLHQVRKGSIILCFAAVQCETMCQHGSHDHGPH